MDDGAAGAAGGGDIRGVQLQGHFKHDVGVCEDWKEAGGAVDGAAGAAGGGDNRELQLAGCWDDAPLHFPTCRLPVGETLLKRCILS